MSSLTLLVQKSYVRPYFFMKFILLFLRHLGSISPTFHAWLFCTKVLRKAFLCLKYRLNFFGTKKLAQMCLQNVGEIDHSRKTLLSQYYFSCGIFLIFLVYWFHQCIIYYSWWLLYQEAATFRHQNYHFELIRIYILYWQF